MLPIHARDAVPQYAMWRKLLQSSRYTTVTGQGVRICEAWMAVDAYDVDLNYCHCFSTLAASSAAV